MNVSGAATQSFSFSQQTTVRQPAPDRAVPQDRGAHSDRARISGRAQALFAALDENQNGRLTNEEFVSGAREILTLAGEGDDVSDEDLARLFDRIDRNDNGVVGRRELRRALRWAEHRADRRDRDDAPAPAPGTTPADGPTRTIQPVSAPRVVQVPPSTVAAPAAASSGSSATSSTPRVVRVPATPVKPTSGETTTASPTPTTTAAPTASSPPSPSSLPAGAFTATLTSVTYISIAIYRYTSISLSTSAPEAPSAPALAA